MKLSNRLKKINFFFILFFIFFVGLKLILFSISWSDKGNKLLPKVYNIHGNEIISSKEILELIKISKNNSLLDIDLKSIKNKIEKHPYIKIAQITRKFPNQININILEREPLAYLNLDEYLVVDNEGFILPLRNGIIEFNIPTLSGFNNEKSLYPIGLKCLSTKTLEAVNYLNSAKEIFPDLVLNISEFKINQSDYYEMILTEKPTKIILKNSYFSKQIFLLKKFNDVINFEKGLEDYKYVDLRYKNQIVVKERIWKLKIHYLITLVLELI